MYRRDTKAKVASTKYPQYLMFEFIATPDGKPYEADEDTEWTDWANDYDGAPTVRN